MPHKPDFDKRWPDISFQMYYLPNSNSGLA